ncbi:MAG: Nramp family divalent metal transporter [Planctomycetota bacterium]
MPDEALSQTPAGQADPATTLDPPTTIGGILRQLGPGLIIAGSIVGSGELIATTAVGAEAGFVLMWLIIIGCVIKVFVQIEFGKYAIINGKTTLDGMNEVPGPRLLGNAKKRANWICWFWLIFTVVARAQVGGLIGGVGQAMSIQFPLTDSGQMVNTFYDEQVALQRADPSHQLPTTRPATYDPQVWAAVITFGSIFILVVGRYRLIQNVSTALVAMFTLITILNLILLQMMPDQRVSLNELVSGMTFTIPPGDGLKVALAAFGIIGVGATELIQYPYWCLEKGYAKWTGPRDDSEAWAKRAEGWLRVLKWDAWCSMVVYTFATIAFYLLGAAILGRSGLNPKGDYLIRMLGEMYVPVFGDWAQAVFLFGAFAVLYSTFFVATASHARVLADGVRLFGISPGGENAYRYWTRIFCGVLPVVFLACFVFIPAPRELVLAGGFMGALMLPLLGVTALYARYRRTDARLLPGKVWDVMLWLSVVGLFMAGGWAFYTKIIEPMLKGSGA